MAEKGTVLVIGSGAAGRSCARSLARNGWRTILAEKGRWGGTCLWYGCIPKKALYHSACVAREVRGAEQFGVRCGSPEIDWQGVLAWKWHSQETYAGDQKALLSEAGVELVEGEARFVAPDAAEVAGERVPFDHAVIATGALAVRPDIAGAEFGDTSDDALRYSELPRSLVIVGGGFVALELAGIYASFGTRVTVLVRGGRILDMLDPELAAAAVRRLGEVEVGFRTRSGIEAIEGERGALRIRVRAAGGDEGVIEAERVLFATGRRPDFDSLNLRAAGVSMDERGRLVLDEYSRTTNPNIWAAGDATGGQMHTPVANYEGRIVATSIDTATPTQADCGAVPITCFTHPQLATVGLTEQEAREQGREVDVRRVVYDDIGAAVVADWRDGFVKAVVDRHSRLVLGVQAAGPQASDVIFSAGMAIRMGMTSDELGEVIGVHPSFAESVYYAGG